MKKYMLSGAAGLGLALTMGLTTLAANAQAAGSMKSMVEVLQMLEQQGYTAFQEIDRDGSHYEVTATSPQGQFVELQVNGTNGQIVGQELED